MQLKCAHCGKEFNRKRLYYKNSKVFCSNLCQIKSRKIIDYRSYFFERVTKGPSGCWLWNMALDKDGYGMVEFDRKTRKRTRAHVFAWELFKGPVPEGAYVCHNCPNGDTPACCNPDHLWIVSPLSNIQDAARKGRMRRGDDSPRSKLRAHQIVEIRKLVAAGEKKNKVAKMFGVAPTTLGNIVKRKIWAHVV